MRAERPVLKKCGPDLITAVDFGKNQPGYERLPGIRGRAPQYIVTSRWSLTWRERWRILVHGDLWLQLMTFGVPLQPMKLLVDEPTPEECGVDL